MIQEADAVKRTLCVLTKIDVTQPISCVISRVSGTAPDAEPFRAGFGYIGISNGGDNRVTDMSSITRIETGFCAPLKNSHPELNERLGLSCLVNALIRNFQVHLRQHVLSNLETAAKSMRKLALDYSDTLGTFIDESNYRQALHNYLLLQ